MNFTDDGFAALLLTTALSPNREEYARPLSAGEFRQLEEKVRASRLGRLSKLMGVDVSGLMIYLDIPEAQAMRLYTLLNRTVEMMYLLEGFARRGIEAVTCYDAGYPRRVNRKLGKDAPAVFFRAGDANLTTRRAVAILGVQGVRTSEDVRGAVRTLVAEVTGRGYTVLTGGEPGVSRVAAEAVAENGGRLLELLGGGLFERVGQPDFLALGNAAAALSLEHPEALFTLSHAAARSRMLFSMADAAFIFNIDGRRGEGEILQSHLCDWVYAWEKRPENRSLITRGAIPFGDLSAWDFDALSSHWSSSDSEQLNIFDLL